MVVFLLAMQFLDPKHSVLMPYFTFAKPTYLPSSHSVHACG